MRVRSARVAFLRERRAAGRASREAELEISYLRNELNNSIRINREYEERMLGIYQGYTAGFNHAIQPVIGKLHVDTGPLFVQKGVDL